MDQLKNFINSISPIPDEEYELIIPIINRIEVKKNTNLLEQGQVCKNVYFVESGLFRMLYVDYEGNEINCHFAMENEFMVDFQSFLTQKPAKYSWRTMQDSTVIALKYDDIHRLYNQSRAWEKFGRLMAEHVYQQLNEREEMLHFQSPEQRYQSLLDSRPDLFNLVSQYHLSSYIGIKPESLSRLRKRLLKR
jgi:CRP-like cAMP-binding protein